MENEPKTRVEFHGRLVALDYLEHHAEAQRVTTYDADRSGHAEDRARTGS